MEIHLKVNIEILMYKILEYPIVKDIFNGI